MRYEVDKFPVPSKPGMVSYFTVDGLIAPAVQRADTDEGWVECAAVKVGDNKLRYYFDYVKEDFVILLRKGKVELHYTSINNDNGLYGFFKDQHYIEPLPSELNKNCRLTS